MPTIQIDIRELPDRFAEILSQSAAGTEIIVTEQDVPRARLFAVLPGQKRVPGLHPGAFKMADDFDAPLPDDFWSGPKAEVCRRTC
jgi:antitoxin (DNA-binding transcriptional repressor) of toxin-antitoxin stability system